MGNMGKAVKPAVEPKVNHPDTNAAYRPAVLNRNQIDPFALIAANKGTAHDRDRAILLLSERHEKMFHAASDSFAQLSTEIAWLHRPWYRRWFRKSPMQKHGAE